MLEKTMFEIFEKRYYFEIEKQYKIRHNISLSISLVAIIFVALSFFFTNFYILKIDPDWISIVAEILFYTSIVFIIVSIYFFAKTLIRYTTYAQIPKSSETLKDIDKLEKYYNDPYFEKKSAKEKKDLIEEDLNQYFKEYYIEATDINITNNIKRSSYIYNTQKFLILSIFCLIICIIPFQIKYTNFKIKILTYQEVSILNKEKVEQIKKPETSKPVPPSKPDKTPLDMVKESEDKPEKKITIERDKK